MKSELFPSARTNRAATRGVALVVTLILLAVITTMAIAFIGLTHRETAAVAGVSSTTDAELAADAGLERAKAEILSRFSRGNQGTNFGREILGPEMFVSVTTDSNRFPNPAGNYYNPAVPLFVNTNRAGQSGPLDERFFLDLNRNGQFEPTGYRAVEPPFNDPVTGTPATNWVVGDPEWVGNLNNPRRYHTNNNRFISRYAYLVQPIGRTLDINAIHNDVTNASTSYGFNRNQGVGTFEINLAAFLTDINTNIWNQGGNGYAYPPGGGWAFQDALGLLSYRFQGPPKNKALSLITLTPGMPNALEFDAYGDGDLNFDNINNPWPGSPNQAKFFTVHDFLQREKSTYFTDFATRLATASRNTTDTYDRYTHYRMLEQLGTDSIAEGEETSRTRYREMLTRILGPSSPPQTAPASPEEDEKLDINYINISPWLDNGAFEERLLASDLIPWSIDTMSVAVPRLNRTVNLGRPAPELFFLSTVRRMILQDTNLWGLLTNGTSLPDKPLRIPVFTNNWRFHVEVVGGIRYTNPLYSGRIQQILQQAANIYDATRHGNDVAGGVGPTNYPTLFQPVFETTGNNVYIVDYKLVQAPRITPADFRTSVLNSNSWKDLDLGQKPAALDNVYNIPIIVGARQGFPNFNEFASKTSFLGVRRMRANKARGETDINKFNLTETFTFWLTNQFGFEAWYSYYSNAYQKPLDLHFQSQVLIDIRQSNTLVRTIALSTNINLVNMPTWQANEFKFTNSGPRLVFFYSNSLPVTASGPTKNWNVSVRNQMRFLIYDRNANRTVDVVGMSVTNEFLDLGTEIARPLTVTPRSLGRLWVTTPASASAKWSEGIANQLNLSQGQPAIDDRTWRNYSATSPNRDFGISNFVDFISSPTRVETEVPFSPVRMLVQTNFWRANDPLVHYLPEDLYRGGAVITNVAFPQDELMVGTPNVETQPWPTIQDSAAKDPTLRDPGVRSSDLWNFPKGPVPNVGWLGRVHRGTPWQTIYFKSDAANDTDWLRHSGARRAPNVARQMRPVQDWQLLDIFTTALHPNATRGRLSINQTNTAAWSAVLSGIQVGETYRKTEAGVNSFRSTNTIVEPAALRPEVEFIVRGINATRGARDFRRFSDILSVRALTFNAPSLTNDLFNARRPVGEDFIYDEDYERIPQQILGLLKLGEPRFVVYSWGQSLKPAEYGVDNVGGKLVARGPSVKTDGSDRGLVLNYQITGELATRAVIRVEFDRLTDNPSDPFFHEFDYRRPRAVVESFNLIPPE